VLALLPAQHLAYPRPVAYDLVLGPSTCVHVTVGAGAPEIDVSDGPRDPAVVQFRVDGDAAALARLLAAGPLRRLLRRGLARRRGDRHAFAALRQLVGMPLWAVQLHRCGVELDASLVLRLAALAVQLAGAPGLAFSLAHRVAGAPAPDATLTVGADGTASVTELALAAVGDPVARTPGTGGGAVRASAEVVCPPGALLGVLLGEDHGDVQTSGDRRPLEIVRAALAPA
jgi:hypothetical protein